MTDLRSGITKLISQNNDLRARVAELEAERDRAEAALRAWWAAMADLLDTRSGRYNDAVGDAMQAAEHLGLRRDSADKEAADA